MANASKNISSSLNYTCACSCTNKLVHKQFELKGKDNTKYSAVIERFSIPFHCSLSWGHNEKKGTWASWTEAANDWLSGVNVTWDFRLQFNVCLSFSFLFNDQIINHSMNEFECFIALRNENNYDFISFCHSDGQFIQLNMLPFHFAFVIFVYHLSSLLPIRSMLICFNRNFSKCTLIHLWYAVFNSHKNQINWKSRCDTTYKS